MPIAAMLETAHLETIDQIDQVKTMNAPLLLEHSRPLLSACPTCNPAHASTIVFRAMQEAAQAFKAAVIHTLGAH